MTRPRLTDRKALLAHRARARRDPILFLHEEALAELQDRLIEVNRTFTSPAIVTGAPEFWGAAFPNATLIADEDVLDLQPGAHDLVIHAMALHWAEDPVGQLVQCRRALVEDGLFLAVLLGGDTLLELRQALAEAETTIRGGLSPRVVPMGEVRDLGALLQRADLRLPVADLSRRRVEYSALPSLIADLRGMGETNALVSRDPKPISRRMYDKTVEVYARHFTTKAGRLRATFDFVFLTGWAPSDAQPTPLRPGSATTRLADALGTVELDAGEKPDTGGAPATGKATE